MAEDWGVYGLWWQAGLVVSVRKARGPYTGLLDLPGGAPDAGETPAQTLRRELLAECGVDVESRGSWHPFDLRTTRDSRGEPIDFRHRGLIAAVRVTGDVQSVRDVEDVATVELIDPTRHPTQEISPLLLHALTIPDEPG